MKLPEDIMKIAKLARCNPNSIQLMSFGQGKRSWYIPVFEEGHSYMSVLWIADKPDRRVEMTSDGLRGFIDAS